MPSKYYSLEKSGNVANLSIYGDITSWPWMDGDVSAVNLSRQLEELGDVSNINVYINSYGGEVAEGLAIYNSLKRHPAQVTTVCDGFACSIASVIFMAGDKRVMNEASLLMIHNAWTLAEGNAEQLRKQADDLETITNASVKAYLSKVSIEEEELRSLMDAETWLEPSKALEYGFATSVEKSEADKPSQNARKKVFEMILNPYQAFDEEETEETEETETEETPEEEPETEETDGETEDEEPEEEPKEAEPESEEPEEDEAKEKQLVFFRAIQHI